MNGLIYTQKRKCLQSCSLNFELSWSVKLYQESYPVIVFELSLISLNTKAHNYIFEESFIMLIKDTEAEVPKTNLLNSTSPITALSNRTELSNVTVGS